MVAAREWHAIRLGKDLAIYPIRSARPLRSFSQKSAASRFRARNRGRPDLDQWAVGRRTVTFCDFERITILVMGWARRASLPEGRLVGSVLLDV